jgi:KUP system potassium uptake protein
MPSLTLNYFGQGALLLRNPGAVSNPFFNMSPDWALIPMVILATAATVIASQALISGAFSVTKQVIQMGFLPRMQIDHTSEHDTGQIYIPLVNWGLFVVIVLAVAMFRSSSNLAAAYGIAVCTDMLITTVLTFFVIRYSWKYPLWLCLSVTVFFLVIDLAFWSSNLLKLADGGWFPLAIAGAILVIMLTWRDGRALLLKVSRANSMELQVFLESLFFSPPVRVEGTAVFMSTQYGMVPNAFLHNLKHNKVLHDTNVFVTVKNHEVPYILVVERLTAKSMGNNCWEVVIHYGFKDDPNVPLALEPLIQHGCNLNPMTTSYFLSRDSIVPVTNGGMAQWREVLFAQMHLNASSAANFLKLPSNAVVEVGSKIEI